MNTPTGQRLAAELLATADALRQCRAAVARLVHADHGALAGQHATRTLLVEGLDVADALEVLAARLGETAAAS
jgi:hypothetical protein